MTKNGNLSEKTNKNIQDVESTWEGLYFKAQTDYCVAHHHRTYRTLKKQSKLDMQIYRIGKISQSRSRTGVV